MKSKFILIGVLIGAVVGILVPFIFPNISLYDLTFIRLSNSSLGYPTDYSSITGSTFSNSISVIWIFFALLGGIFGFIIFKLKQLFVNKKF